MTLLDTLSAAADEINTELAPGSVELRLRGREPGFVVTAPPPEWGRTAVDVAPTRSAAADPDAVVADDGPAARINVRLPEQLKAAVEEAAAKEGRSVNAWLVRAAAAALHPPAADPRLAERISDRPQKQAFTGWVR